MILSLLAAASLAAPAPADGARGESATSRPLAPLIHAAADEFHVPEVLLAALVWEASHDDPHAAFAWAGYGPLDLRDDGDPSVEAASLLLGESPDALIADPAQNIRGGAAMLADQARRANGGVLPDRSDLESWYPAIAVFSGSETPFVQERFGEAIYTSIYTGVDAVAGTGERVRFGGMPVDLPALFGDRPPALPDVTDYAGAAAFVPANAANYTNDSRSPASIDTIVIHTMQGSYSGSIAWFQNSAAQASAHYCVRSSDGEVTQTVREADIAWHAGNWTYNTRSIGIEHEGFIDDPSWYTDAMYAGSAALTRDIIARTGVVADRDHIISHIEVPDPDGSGWGGAGHHTDPGPYWDWDYYMSLVTGSNAIVGDLTGVVADSDVHVGTRIVGASVWLDPTGDTAVSGSLGEWIFHDLPEGTYTVHASAPGYDEGTCTKTIDASSTFWCSIALFPAQGDADTDADADSDTDTDSDADTDTGVLPDGAGGPGLRQRPAEAKGCGCDSTGSGAVPWFLAAAILARRERRKPSRG